jgi:di/tricarboxylate transporter
MEWQGWFTLAVVVLALVAMVRELSRPDIVMMAALFTLAAAGILEPSETFGGFSNEALAAIGFLFIVSAGLRETGALELTMVRLFSPARGTRSGLARICPPVAFFSAFLNNAPIVAMLTPSVIEWARRRNLTPSRFLIPLSYSSILGSITTVIGTSTTLTVAALVIKQSNMERIGFFELFPVGLPIAAAGLLYLYLISPKLLPARREPAEVLGARRREYTATMIVQSGSSLAGQTIEQAGLRHLPGLFLVEIDREGRILTPVGPDEEIHTGDRLVFAGVISTIVELQRIKGFVPATDDETPSPTSPAHRLVEAVVSPSSPLVGRSIRDANFRTVYDAAVIAVHRNGERVPGKIGEIELRAGDTLLMQGSPDFLRAHRNSPDFHLVSEIPDSEGRRWDRAWTAIGILVGMVLVASGTRVPISYAAFGGAGLMLLTRCLNRRIALQSVDWSILVVIGAGLGIASAMQKTGAAASVAGVIAGSVGGLGPMWALAAVYVTTLVMAEFLHHNAAVALMFPIAVAAAGEVGADPRPFVMAVAIAGCCAFANPVAYQTHLIVYGPGGYRFADFVRVGLPLDVVCAVIALSLIPWAWPL